VADVLNRLGLNAPEAADGVSRFHVLIDGHPCRHESLVSALMASGHTVVVRRRAIPPTLVTSTSGAGC
jgi:hypothetical protein